MNALPMPKPHNRRPLSRLASRLARLGRLWLVCASFLVPFAQAVASWHTERVEASDCAHASGPASLQHAGCDLCLTAAALSGGAGPPALPVPMTAAVRHEAPLAAVPLEHAPLCHWYYRSRAPPPA